MFGFIWKNYTMEAILVDNYFVSLLDFIFKTEKPYKFS